MRNSKQTHATANSEQATLNANEAGSLDVPIPTEADRIALTNMFKAIAEYGRRVRLRRLAEADPLIPEISKKSEEKVS
ncbi:MAG: hypothetical protein ACOYZ8_04175 [Chloroflexota bacterium]